MLPGVLVDLALTVTSPSSSEPFAPTGPAALRANFTQQTPCCASHTDPDPGHAPGGTRIALSIPGLGADYLLMPDARFVEDDLGAASLQGTVRRQGQWRDAWTLALTFSGRVAPGEAGHPPLSNPIQDLLPSSYASNGGPIDPAAWRYYTTVTGTLLGLDDNDGGALQLIETIPAHVGLGAGQNNTLFGIAAELAVTVTQQPVAHTVQPTGDATLRANLGVFCVLPAPVVTSGNLQTIDTVTHDKLLFTGTDLGFIEQAALGPWILGADQRRWRDGYVRVIDFQTVEVSIPQALAAGSY
ncbi:MAG: hypothetical protein KAI24_14045, partial [Planctomycetes bacterium]|nr:hypothetical protein [Planctomycetota bacterium]